MMKMMIRRLLLAVSRGKSHLKCLCSTAPTSCQVLESLDAYKKRSMEKIMAEYEVWKSADPCMPKSVKDADWLKLLGIKERRGRISYLWYLGKLEMDREMTREKRQKIYKAIADAKELKKQEAETSNHLVYGYDYNTLIAEPMDSSMIKACRWRILSTIRTGGPKIVFDFGFMRYLDWNEQNITILQVAHAVGTNRSHKEPFHLHFTGVDVNSDYWKKLTTAHLQHFERHYDYMITVSSKSLLDSFPADKIVYLTPMARQPLENFDDDQVYILGAMVDKNHPQDVCAYAKRVGIKTAKLPLFNHVSLPKLNLHASLPLTHVLGILLDYRLTQNWREAIISRLPGKFSRPEADLESREVRVEMRQRRGLLAKMVTVRPDVPVSLQHNPIAKLFNSR